MAERWARKKTGVGGVRCDERKAGGRREGGERGGVEKREREESVEMLAAGLPTSLPPTRQTMRYYTARADLNPSQTCKTSVG